MVARYGMSDEIGPVVFDNDSGEVFLGRDYGHVVNYSERTSSRIDAEIERLMREAYDKTVEILKAHFDKLKLVAETLMEKEKLSGDDFKALMENGRLPEAEDNSSEETAFEEVSETEIEIPVEEANTEETVIDDNDITE
jgi:cell division protease FtsH